MKLNRYHLTPRSALGTHLKSDTLTGQLLCLYRELKGESALNSWLANFKKGQPPFILSDAFPYNTLPVPVLPPISREQFKRIAKDHFDGKMFNALSEQKKMFNALSEQKKFKKQFQWIPLSVWKLLKDGFSVEKLLTDFIKRKQDEQPIESFHSLEPDFDALLVASKSANEQPIESFHSLELHNIIHRGTGRTLEAGGLFVTENTWYLPKTNGQPVFDLYALVDPQEEQTLDTLLLDTLGSNGFGADRTVGKGQLKIEKSKEDCSFLIKHPQTSSEDKGECQGTSQLFWLNLSTYCSQNPADLKGFYKTRTKFGKVWNGFGEMNPFKHPLLVFESGSVFQNQPADLSNTVIQGIHPDNKAVIQCTSPIMIPFILQQEAL
ncbi:hypothetical protein WDW89_03835 [Deltaproteobacteria bacterium TL4]